MTTNKKKPDLLKRISLLKKYYEDGLIPTLAEHEVNPDLPKDSRLNYIYFTLPVCLNFQRSSPSMWQAALKTYQDPETNYLFYPEVVVQGPREKIQKDLLKHKLGLQLNKHTDIWIAISKAFNTYFDADPRKLFESANYDVLKSLNIIQVTHKNDFPYLRGPKLSNYWLYILSHYTDLKLSNMHEISIIPDTHIIKSSEYLGMVPAGSDPLLVVATWKELLAGHEFSPVDMHAVLWNWSRAGFKPKV